MPSRPARRLHTEMGMASQLRLDRVEMSRFCVDPRLCIGCGLCEERAPGNLVVPACVDAAQVIRQPANEAELIAVGQAADYCPSGALTRVDDVATARRRDDDNRRNYEPGPHALEV